MGQIVGTCGSCVRRWEVVIAVRPFVVYIQK